MVVLFWGVFRMTKEYTHKKYKSMFEAVQAKDQEAIKEFEEHAKTGEQIRVM